MSREDKQSRTAWLHRFLVYIPQHGSDCLATYATLGSPLELLGVPFRSAKEDGTLRIQVDFPKIVIKEDPMFDGYLQRSMYRDPNILLQNFCVPIKVVRSMDFGRQQRSVFA
jgi:hypothetical protein